MGWNSFDCYDLAVTEDDVLGNAETIAKHLKPFGYEYVVVDMSWYDPLSAAWGRSDVPLVMDEFGRLQPCPVKFPSSAGGKGFKPLADRIHALGLKFGFHIMRGLTKQAVRENTPIFGSASRAADIADPSSGCSWWEHTVGLDAAKPGAQDWYDSLAQLYAAWDADFIKADDMSFPYARREIELFRRALDKTGRAIVLSLSPGETPLAAADHVCQHAQMWRISGDFWDEWPQLLKMFDLLERWNPHMGGGCWPDADMLPVGVLNVRRNPPVPVRVSRFTQEEQQTLMTLWCMARSPLMIGADVRVLDPLTFKILTNPEVLAINQRSRANRLFARIESRIIWRAEDDQAVYLALFNTSDKPETQIMVNRREAGIADAARIHELWTRQIIEPQGEWVGMVVPPHGARILKGEK